MFDDVIQRQEPPEIGPRIGKSPVADVGNAQLPVDALVGDPAGTGAVLAANDGNGFFHGKFQVQEALNEAPGLFGVRVAIGHVLGACEHTAVETDQGHPLGVLRVPPERLQVFFTARANE